MTTAFVTREAWTREEVYGLVWSQPLTKLVSTFGISNVAIGKNCRKLKIPLPGRGYWARKAHGYKDPRQPLPPLHERAQFVWNRREPEPEPTPAPPPRPSTAEEIEDQREFDRIDQLLASGAFVLKRPGRAIRHPLLAATRRAFGGSRAGTAAAPLRDDDAPLNIRVSDPLRRRALGILGTVIAILEELDIKVRTDARRTSATIFGQVVCFKITERWRRVPPTPPKPSAKPSLFPRASDLVPTGELTFHIMSEHDYTLHKWRDGVRTKIEDAISEIVAEMMKTAVRYRRTAEERRLADEMKRRRIEELRRLKIEIEAEDKRVAQLEQSADQWRRARLIREYALAVFDHHKEKGTDISADGRVGLWMTWALEQADRFDPLTDNPASILDRRDELKELPPWY